MIKLYHYRAPVINKYTDPEFEKEKSLINMVLHLLNRDKQRRNEKINLQCDLVKTVSDSVVLWRCRSLSNAPVIEPMLNTKLS